jgi:acetylornithine/succinyldiaminopimelate/putrescine aminotransferase
MIAAGGQEKYRVGFDPIPAGFSHVPYGDAEALERAIGPKTAAVLIEPVLGEGGVVVPPVGYLKRVRELTSREGALLILDEVQTGVGRTGTLFAYEQEGVRPDIMSLAKGLAGGIPIGAMLCTNEVARGFEVGSHNTTFGGNPLACACALAVLSKVSRPEFLSQIQRVGAHLSARLLELAQRRPGQVLGERGKGLMRALVLKGGAKKVVDECRARGLLVNAIGKDVVRMVPPLTLTEAQVEEAAEILNDVFAKA